MRVIRAMSFGGPEVLELAHVPDPTAGPGQVVVDVSFAPVLYLDTQIRAGRARDWFPTRPPFVPGAGIAGVVAEVGAGVDADWIGRRVVVDTPSGGYLERALVPVERLVTVPEGLGLDVAGALLHDGRTALRLMELLDPHRGEWVLVVGAAGGLGTLLVQLAHAAGAHVAAAARGTEKLQLARELGAEVTIDYTQSGWPQRVLELTGSDGMQVVFDGVGGQIGSAAFEVAARGGRFSAHGTPGGSFTAIDRAVVDARNITVFGIQHVQLGPADASRLIAEALSVAVAGRIKPVIGQTFALEDAAEAHRTIESRTAIGKTLLEVVMPPSYLYVRYVGSHAVGRLATLDAHSQPRAESSRYHGVLPMNNRPIRRHPLRLVSWNIDPERSPPAA